MPYRGKRATVMGLGHFGGGAAAARWLAAQGAIVTVTDLADERVLAPALQSLAGVPINAFHLGGHREDDFRQADLVVVNPAVRPDNPWLAIARENGVRLTTEIDLFLDACPAATIGVTGSNGKSTTAAMIAAILQADGRRTWLGGNIGGSLLDHLDEIKPDDGVVIELSSFQLTYLRPETRAAAYWRGNELFTEPSRLARQHGRLCGGQADSAPAATAGRSGRAQHARSAAGLVGTPVRGRVLPLVADDEIARLRVPGWHNRMNAACAATAALGAGCSRDADRPRAAIVPRPAATHGVDRPDRGPHVLQ